MLGMLDLLQTFEITAYFSILREKKLQTESLFRAITPPGFRAIFSKLAIFSDFYVSGNFPNCDAKLCS